MRLFLLALFSLSFCLPAKAQNLVSNNGFEDINICIKYKKGCNPEAWRTTNLKLLSYPKEKDVARYVNLVLFNAQRDNDRKFAQTKLLCKLERGETYTVKMKVKPNLYRIESMSVLFQDSLTYAPKNEFLLLSDPDVLLKIPADVEENQWYELEGEYVANGRETYLLIGNFLLDSLSESNVMMDEKTYKKYLKNNVLVNQVIYGIDDVMVVPKSGDKPRCNIEQVETEIYEDNRRHSFPSSARKLDGPIVQMGKGNPVQNVTIRKQEKYILNDLGFDFDKSEIKNKEEIDKVLNTLLKLPSHTRIEITGYTDNVGETSYNQVLSMSRAQSVFYYLKENGIDGSRMKYSGKGEASPVATNDNPVGRRQNRRVEVHVFW